MKLESSQPPTLLRKEDKDFSSLLLRLGHSVSSSPASLMSMRHLHNRVMARHQLQQSLAQPLQHAGPLHSARLAQQALQRLQHIAPAYVQRFLLYADALRALEDARTHKPKASKVKAARKTTSTRRQPGSGAATPAPDRP